MTEQIGNKMCECHECTQARYRSSFQGQMDAAIRPAQISSELSRLTSGLRELAEKWEGYATALAQDGHEFSRGQAGIYDLCREDILTVLPEATKPSLATKEVPE